MAKQNPQNPPGPKVSSTRTIVSLVLLLVVGVVCVIELRAGFGQMMTGKAMAARSEEGVFSGVTVDEAKAMLALAPSESIERDDPTEIVYRYEWFSLLRPLMGETSPQLFLVTQKGDNPVAVAFHTAAEEELEEVKSMPMPAGMSEMPAGMGMGGPPGGMGGPPGGMGGPPGGMGGPPGGIVRPGAPGGPDRQRPAAEDDDSAAPDTSLEPLEPPAVDPAAETPADPAADTSADTSADPAADPAADAPEETPTPAREDEAPSNPESETPPN